jgi:hypothetical protein
MAFADFFCLVSTRISQITRINTDYFGASERVILNHPLTTPQYFHVFQVKSTQYLVKRKN